MEIEARARIGGGQDGAVFGGLLFRFDAAGRCRVYRMDALAGAGEPGREVKPVGGFALDRRELLCPHSNAVSFGVPDGEAFPPLYTNVYTTYRAEADRRKGVCAVYRLRRTAEGFTSALCQVLRVGFTEDPALWHSSPRRDDVRPYGNFLADPARGLLHVFTMRDADRTTRYFTFRLPEPGAGKVSARYGVPEVVLEEGDILRQFDCPYHHFLQGACLHGGLIYSVEGFTGDPENPPALRIIDPEAGRQVFFEEFRPRGRCEEAELIDFWEGDCWYSDVTGHVYRIRI